MQENPALRSEVAVPAHAAGGSSVDPEVLGRLAESISRVFLGKQPQVELAMIALLARGHLLIEDVPGVGKTTLARVLAASIDGAFKRVQFTPDLLPSDVLGVSVYKADEGHFVFQPGPVFTNILLADEINRTTPRTQSCLLEAMNEGQVSIDGDSRALPAPFMVVATQNPLEYLGTYPLPESQLDRFLLRMRIGYPDRATERAVMRSRRAGDPATEMKPVVAADEIVRLQDAVRDVRIDDAIEDYMMDLVHATRGHDDIEVGLSPRASLAMMTACQARAAIRGRDFVTPDDVKVLAVPIFSHRIVVADGVAGDTRASEAVVADLVESVPSPR